MHYCTGDAADAAVVYEPSPSESLSEGVVRAVATASNRDPVAPDGLAPLATVLDPDALDSLFETVGADTNRSDGQVTFRYHGWTVTVEYDGTIIVFASAAGTTTD